MKELLCKKSRSVAFGNGEMISQKSILPADTSKNYAALQIELS